MLVTKAVKMCATCGKSVSSVSYARHLRSHAAGTYVCEHCDEEFKNNYGLKRHVLTRHASTDERPLVCSVCEQRFARREHLDAHCARVHLNEAREQIEASRAQVDTLHVRLDAVQANLTNTTARAAELQAERDRLFLDIILRETQEDNSHVLPSAALSSPTRRRSAPRCKCNRFHAAILGDVRRCSSPECHNVFHWICAGYGRPLAPDAHVHCADCLRNSTLTVEAIEDASNEVALLDAYLVVRGLRREPVAKDGLCLFAAVARTTGHAADDLFQETMTALSTYDFTARDPTVDAAEEAKLQHEAASHATRRLRMTGRWDSRLLDFAVFVLIQRFNLACFHANGRTVREDPADHPGVGGRICCYGRGIKMDHYDAVVVS